MAVGDYCVLQDVQNWLPSDKKINSQVGGPTTGTVSGWITDFSGEINVAAVKGGAVVPLTDTNLTSLVKKTLARELAYQVMAARSTVKDTKTDLLYESWHQEYLDMLQQFRDGEFATPASTAGSAWSYLKDSVAGSDSADPSIDPKVRVDKIY